MQILKMKNVEVELFAGLTTDTAKAENVIAKIEDDKTFYTVDFEQLMIVVVYP